MGKYSRDKGKLKLQQQIREITHMKFCKTCSAVNQDDATVCRALDCGGTVFVHRVADIPSEAIEATAKRLNATSPEFIDWHKILLQVEINLKANNRSTGKSL